MVLESHIEESLQILRNIILLCFGQIFGVFQKVDMKLVSLKQSQLQCACAERSVLRIQGMVPCQGSDAGIGGTGKGSKAAELLG